ncbi:MAG TPA: hypothetical protein VFH03_17985 [Actinoplanes sp.]|nr:hypothetical protein [Actinoplanes sp.]
MAGETGSAREEAERLVATVLAIAQQSGRDGGVKRDDDSIAASGARLVDGLGTLGDTLAGMVGHLAGASGRSSAERPPDPQRRPAEDRTGERPPGGRRDAPQPGEGRAGPQRDEGQPGTRPVRYGWATGSAECCVCPICRTMANLRDPTPESAARLATGAGDLATGVAGLMRALSALSGTRPARRRPSRPAPPPPPDPDLAWSAATRSGRPAGPPAGTGEDAAGRTVEDLPDRAVEDPAPDPDSAPWAAATRAAAREQQQRDAQARAQKKRDAEARAQRRRDAEARRRDAEARAQQPGDRSIDRDESKPGAASTAGFGEDVWAAATADRPAPDPNDAGRGDGQRDADHRH